MEPPEFIGAAVHSVSDQVHDKLHVVEVRGECLVTLIPPPPSHYVVISAPSHPQEKKAELQKDIDEVKQKFDAHTQPLQSCELAGSGGFNAAGRLYSGVVTHGCNLPPNRPRPGARFPPKIPGRNRGRHRGRLCAPVLCPSYVILAAAQQG